MRDYDETPHGYITNMWNDMKNLRKVVNLKALMKSGNIGKNR